MPPKAQRAAKEKKPPGRPVSVGATSYLGGKVPPALIEQIDKWAKNNGGLGRSEAMRALIELGLRVKGKK